MNLSGYRLLSLSLVVLLCLAVFATVYSGLAPQPINVPPKPASTIEGVASPMPTFVAEPDPTATSPTVASGPLRVYFLNVGQGDGALLVTPDGVTALIDGGDTPRGTGLVNWLRSVGIEHVDWVMPSHPHVDHMGGLNAVLERLPVGGVLMSSQQNPTAAQRRQEALIADKGIPLTIAEEGIVLQLGSSVTATVLNPPIRPLLTSEPIEDNSVVLRVCLQQTCTLFTGDIGDQGERALLARYQDKPTQLQSQILKVSHHGSAEPNYPPLLALIRPQIALIGVGAGNQFGHPTKNALDRLKTVGSTVYCTHTDGTIVVEIAEAGYTVKRLPDVVIRPTSGLGVPPLPELAGTCAG